VDKLLLKKESCGYAGNFDLVESHNEQWLILEGLINEKYGIDGIKKKDLPRLKKKSIIPFVRHHCQSPQERVMANGCSMGAYHAVNFF